MYVLVNLIIKLGVQENELVHKRAKLVDSNKQYVAVIDADGEAGLEKINKNTNPELMMQITAE